MKKRKVSGGVLVFLGALFWSLNAPLIKLISLDGVLVCGMRSIIAAAVLLPTVRIKQLKWNWWMLLYVVSYGALSISVILALEMTDSAIAIGMQYTSIVWLWFISLAKGKRILCRESVPVVLVILGVLLFMVGGTDGGHLKGNLIALCEGIFFLGMTVSAPKASGGNPLGLTAIANLAVGSFVFLFLRPDMDRLTAGGSINWIVLLILGVVQVGGGYGLYNMGLQRVTPQKAAMLSLWEMILGPLWVALFLREFPNGMVLAGFAIVLTGLFLDIHLSKETERKGEIRDEAGSGSTCG